MIDYTKLKAELSDPNSPLANQYPQWIASGNDDMVSQLLNDSTNAGAGIVSLSSIDKGVFLLQLAAPAALALANLSNEMQNKWDRILAIVNAAPGNINTGEGSPTLFLFAMAVNDGLLTKDQINVVVTKTGSRAEVLFGTGTIIRHQDIAIALRDTN